MAHNAWVLHGYLGIDNCTGSWSKVFCKLLVSDCDARLQESLCQGFCLNRKHWQGPSDLPKTLATELRATMVKWLARLAFSRCYYGESGTATASPLHSSTTLHLEFPGCADVG